jgi:hypothetical protein
LLRGISNQENEAYYPNMTSNLSQSDKMQQQHLHQHNIEKDEIQLNCKQLEGMDSLPLPWYMQQKHQPHLLKSYPYGRHITCRQLPSSGSPPYTQLQLADVLNSPEVGYKAIIPIEAGRKHDTTNKQIKNTGYIRHKASDKHQQIFTDV